MTAMLKRIRISQTEEEVKRLEVNKEILIQYSELREEIKDLRKRIERDEDRLRKIKEEGEVTDTVVGTRKDGTIGSIRIVGFPFPEYNEIESMIKKRIAKLHIMEEELLEAVNAVDDFINSIPRSELRQIFRLYYIDDLTWEFVAMRMNYIYPNRKNEYTKDSCRMKHNRYLENKEIL